MGRRTFEANRALDKRRRTVLILQLRRLALFGGLGMMVVVPIGALDDERPAVLGWQMYAAVVDLPEIAVVLSDGSREERSIGAIASGLRPEIDYFEPVARFVCSREPNAVAVHMTRERPSREVVLECGKF